MENLDFSEINGSNGILEIMPLGDSITRGEDAKGSQAIQAGYRDALSARLKTRNIAFDFVGSLNNGIGFDSDHEGHGGKTIGYLFDNVNRWLAQNPAEVILLKIGTNDMGFSPNQTPIGAANLLGELIDRIAVASPSSQILVSSIAPPNPLNLVNAPFFRDILSDFGARVAAFNRLVLTVVKTKASSGRRVSFVDVASGLTPITDISIDGLHPNDDGYRKISNTYASAIQALGTELVEGPNTKTGTPNTDHISGTASDDHILGLAGDDKLYGLAGDDTLRGGIGNDTLIGYADNDFLIGGHGSDRLFGNGGNDTLNGAGSSGQWSLQIDILEGGSGNNTYVLQTSEQYAYAGFGNKDYALIRGFDATTDKITLGRGSYRLSDVSNNAGIFNQNNELIGLVEGYRAADLEINSDRYFIRF